MDASGSAREGWMTFIPLMVLLFIVMYVMGGPAQFVNTIAYWTMDMANYVVNWVKHF
jgi:hypothetical protein